MSEDKTIILPVELKDALEQRYLSYALSTIMHRALPDVRDGLKPVHRRLLYAMRLLKLDPSAGYKKCARVVGDVIGKYHPHGDQSVYDALVRLAQDFAVRYPLVEGQGNFGNIDGDNAAAMRYTESRLTSVAQALLEGLDEDAVDFRETYDGEDKEPLVLPSAFPNLLANGSTGIAVGMATSIPPHNAAELCKAALHLIKHPSASVEKLMEFVKGPDFPTGGVIVEPQASMLEAYRTGRGSFRTRAKWNVEDTGRGSYVIVITEIPYGVQKSRLIERIADVIIAKKLPLLTDVRDESAEDVRIVLEPRSRNVDAAILMEGLFKLSDLEVRVPLNLNVLNAQQVPGVMSLGQALNAWLAHRREVLQRRSQHRLDKIAHRINVLGGYLIAYLNLDEVIRIIREEDEAKAALMARFELNDVQAEAILNMRLRALRKLEEFEIRKEYDALSGEQEALNALLSSEDKQWYVISEDIKATIKEFGPTTPLGARRSEFAIANEADVTELMEAMIEREPVTIVLSKMGWVRAVKGHTSEIEKLTFKGDDALHLAIQAQTTDKLLLLASDGRVFTIGVDKLPGGRGFGEPLRLIVDLGQDDDVVDAFLYQGDKRRILASTDGRGFIVKDEDLLANTRKGKQILNLDAGQKARFVRPILGDHVAVIGENRKLVVFRTDEIPEMTRSKGVRLQRYRDGGISDIISFDGAVGLVWKDNSDRSYSRSLEALLEWRGARGLAGRMAPQGFPKANIFAPISQLIKAQDDKN